MGSGAPRPEYIAATTALDAGGDAGAQATIRAPAA
jgi:hypothetical protein